MIKTNKHFFSMLPVGGSRKKKLSKVPRGHLVGPGIYLFPCYSHPLVRSLIRRARESGRKAGKQKKRGGQGAERGHRVSAYYYNIVQRRRINAIPLPDDHFLDGAYSTQIPFAR